MAVEQTFLRLVNRLKKTELVCFLVTWDCPLIGLGGLQQIIKLVCGFYMFFIIIIIIGQSQVTGKHTPDSG